jgi:group I intron endonuclease
MTTSIYSSKKPIGKIYLTTNIVNGLQYVGQTQCLYKKTYKGSGKMLIEAFTEFGKDKFITVLLEYVYCRSQLDPLECKWIVKKNTIWPNGYNLQKGGGGVTLHTEETKEKCREASTGKKASIETKKKMSKSQKGRKQSLEAKIKISEANKGKKHSDESKRKMSKATMGSLNNNYGKTFSKEHKKKMSESARGKKHSEETKQKMSEDRKGRKHSVEAKQNMSRAQTGRKQKLVECPYCNKIGGLNGMTRHHFNNCKMKGLDE